MNQLTENQIKRIEEFSLKYYKKLDEMHGIGHAKRTVQLAKYLAKKEDANPQIVRLGALLHQFHNGKIVESFLKKIKVDKETKNQLVHCVECSSSKNIHKAETIEAKVVYDADKLQVIGPFGVIREICCDVELRGAGFRQAVKHARVSGRRLYNTLQTKTAKKLAQKLHQFMLKFWRIFDKWNRVQL